MFGGGSRRDTRSGSSSSTGSSAGTTVPGSRNRRNGKGSSILMRANLRGPSALDRNRAPASASLSSRRNPAIVSKKGKPLLTETRPKFPAPPEDAGAPVDVMKLVKGSVGDAKCHILSFLGGSSKMNLHRLPEPIHFSKELPEELFQERDVHEGAGSEFGSRQREEARRRRYERRLKNNPELREVAQLRFEDAEGKEYLGTQRASASSGYRYFFVMPGAEDGAYQAVPADDYYEVRLKPKTITFSADEAEELMKQGMSVSKLEKRLEAKRQEEVEERRRLRERMKLVENPDEQPTETFDDEESRDLARLQRKKRDNASLLRSIEQDGEDDIDNVEDGFEPPAEDQVYAIPDQADRVGMVQESTLESEQKRMEMKRYFGEVEEGEGNEDEDAEPVEDDDDDIRQEQEEREHELKVLHGIEEEPEKAADETMEGEEEEEDEDDVPSDFDPDEDPDELVGLEGATAEGEEASTPQTQPPSQRGRKKKGTQQPQSKRKAKGRQPSSKRAKRG